MTTSDATIVAYAVYALIAVGMTIWLARILSRNGALFLTEVFAKSPGLAEAVNKLLVVGFYLINLGFASVTLKADRAKDLVGAIESLSVNLGQLLLALGAMHLGNLWVLSIIRHRAQEKSATDAPAPWVQAGANPSALRSANPWVQVTSPAPAPDATA